jgi:hypothetical protein
VYHPGRFTDANTIESSVVILSVTVSTYTLITECCWYYGSLFHSFKELTKPSTLILSVLKLLDMRNLKVPVHRNASVIVDLQRIFCIQFVYQILYF